MCVCVCERGGGEQKHHTPPAWLSPQRPLVCAALLTQVDVTTPEEYMGDIIGDLNSRRGLIEELGERGNAKTVSAVVPLGNMFQYVSTLRGMSKGRASYSMKLARYDFVPANIEKVLIEKYNAGIEDGGDK